MIRRLTLVILSVASLLTLWPSMASATFPGKNGRIAFTAYHDYTEQCPPDSFPVSETASDEAIFTMNADGSDASQVTAIQHRPPYCDVGVPVPPSFGLDDDPSYSPSSQRLVFSLAHYDSEDGWFGSIGVIGSDGTSRRSLTHGLEDWQPSFSPDGKKIAFARFSRITLMRSDADISAA